MQNEDGLGMQGYQGINGNKEKYKYWAPKIPSVRGRGRGGRISVSGRLKKEWPLSRKENIQEVFKIGCTGKKKKKVFQSGGKIDQLCLMLLTDKEI